MPVDDIEVHDKVKITSVTPYGCSNTGRSGMYYTQVRHYRDDGRFELVYKWVADRASKLCRYDARPTDPRCGGCKLPSDEEYLKENQA